uniref:Uncharacterized protein n=1 Tax=Pinguiococcus pyrenoidosus TaxID=172671 RepID=A0A7R9YFR3_9STRA|mmetsp:Transcript_8907/g.33628  ORF Transcript_8907/g.33628 Transcript_8907/m.33628 type:complete len:458 (+) Transcript_8907:147-1520(+)
MTSRVTALWLSAFCSSTRIGVSGFAPARQAAMAARNMFASTTSNAGASAEREVHETTHRLLDNEEYHIEFNGYLSNHVKHAVVALHGLQASPADIQRYWDFYTECTPYGFHLAPKGARGEPLRPAEWKQLLGKKQKYEELLQFFDDEEKQLGIEKTLQKYAPSVLPGSPGALTHGIIHLGWGLDANNRRMILEGLAYMVYSFVSTHPERFVHGAVPESTPMESFLRIAEADRREGIQHQIFETAVNNDKYGEASNFHAELIPAGFQWQVAKVLEEGHPVLYQMPTWLDELPVEEALKQLYKAVTLIYLTTAGEPDAIADEESHGSFLALHLITSLWGAEKIATHLPVDEQRALLKTYYVTVLALLLTSSSGFPTVEALRGVEEKFDVNDATEESSVAADWEGILTRAIAEEEEHNIKLAYVARELWRRYDHWKAFRVAASTFTLTPDIGPGRSVFGA